MTDLLIAQILEDLHFNRIPPGNQLLYRLETIYAKALEENNYIAIDYLKKWIHKI